MVHKKNQNLHDNSFHQMGVYEVLEEINKEQIEKQGFDIHCRRCNKLIPEAFIRPGALCTSCYIVDQGGM